MGSVDLFWTKVEKGSSVGCWLWKGSVSKRDGNGVYFLDGRCHLVHKLAYTLKFGELKSNTRVFHYCGNKLCCNPDHMYLPAKERVESRLWGGVSKSLDENGCWEWQGHISSNGYGRIQVNDKAVSTHRLAWILTNGEIPNGLHVCHKCDNRKCCNPSHLFLGTAQDNVDDMWLKGRHPILKGEQVKHAKAKEFQVMAIREHRKNTQDSYKQIALKFGLSESIVKNIVLRKTWKHVK